MQRFWLVSYTISCVTLSSAFGQIATGIVPPTTTLFFPSHTVWTNSTACEASETGGDDLRGTYRFTLYE